MSCEPDYVANLKKYFNDLHNTGTYYKKIASKERKWCVSVVTYKNGCRFSSLISLPMVMNNLSPMILCWYSKALTCWCELRNGCREIVGVWSSSKRKTLHLTLCRPDPLQFHFEWWIFLVTWLVTPIFWYLYWFSLKQFKHVKANEIMFLRFGDIMTPLSLNGELKRS